MSDVPPTQSCSQIWINSSFMKNHLCPTGHFAITGCLRKQEQHMNIYCSIPHVFIHHNISYLANIASFANTISSGATSTILPVRVSRAHLGSSGSYTICLETQADSRYYVTQTHSSFSQSGKVGVYTCRILPQPLRR